MFSTPLDRRRFLAQTGLSASALAALGLSGCDPQPEQSPALPTKKHVPIEPTGMRLPYRGPNVIVCRFGGGVRRQETITEPVKTYCPFIYHELAGRHGVLFDNMVVDLKSGGKDGIDTSHGQGTLYLLTGQYRHYVDISNKPLADRFIPEDPTFFEYFREKYDIPEHQALIINGEDRINEDFFTFSNHHLFGINYRSMVLSLYGFKTYLLKQQLAGNGLSEKERAEKEKKLQDMEHRDYRVHELGIEQPASPQVEAFWERWRAYYGDTGLVNPRGDRLLTTLALRALKELRPRLLMVNYQDTDYVHWGNPNFYTRAIAVIDEGIREIYNTVQADEEYRNNTIFVVVPDCGRDNNRFMAVPYQHHFNSRSAREIFAVVAGPGIRDRFRPEFVIPRQQEQISVGRTIAELMSFTMPTAEADSLLKVV